MKPSRTGQIAAFIVILALIFTPSLAEAKKRHKAARKARPAPAVAGTASYADIVIDAETGRILHSSSSGQLRHPASLTKMMTLYLTFQALEDGKLRLNQSLSVSANAAEQSPSKLGLRAGQRIRVEDAVLGLVTESANDAAVVLAEAQGGSTQAFAQMMTAQAQALGMTRTRFSNPSGLPDPDQVTTARDMALLGHALIYHFADYYPYFSHESFTYAGNFHNNHNRLMRRYDGMDGIKTGYIRASGFNLVASARRGSTRLIGVVFGGRSTISRDNRMAQLLDEGFARVQREKNGIRTASADMGEGDSGDSDSGGEYLALPSKVAAVYPSRDDMSPRGGGGGSWGIQIGAYSSPQIARQTLTRIVNTMPQLLAGADPVAQQVSSGDTIMYRARLMGLQQKTAQSVCSWLLQRGQSCMTVGP
ncbi:MAG: D-alanyl-D-alanine carboxypeptidase family protein [Alphaproteobacteria bacterium]|nr:D-alanyl-D-alanine carboxypeptidase family protein [Alphaproteobacteria bacterium]